MKTKINMLLFTMALAMVIGCGGKKSDEDFGKKPIIDNATYPLADKGKAIFEGKGICITCHKLDVKLVGPSIQEIAKIYKKNKISVAKFLTGTEEPVIDPAQYEVMKINFEITKNFTDEERQAVEQYIFSQGK